MDIKSIATGAAKGLETIAPWIATALGGPMAGSAVTWAEKALGVAPGTFKNGQDILNAVAGGTPEQRLAFKQADNDFALHMQQLGFQDVETLAKIAEDDRDSARKREIAVKDWTPKVLAYGVTIGFFAILGFMLAHALPDGAKDPLLIMLGALQSAWVGVITYYFGSSSGSDRKTELLAVAPSVNDASATKG